MTATFEDADPQPKRSAAQQVTEGSVYPGTITFYDYLPYVGETLTLKLSGWWHDPSEMTYLWFNKNGLIEGATSNSYVLQPQDGGGHLYALAYAVGGGYRTGAVSTGLIRITDAPVITTGTASIAGAPRVGEQLSAVAKGWSPANVKFSYQWMRSNDNINYTPIAGATTATYNLTVDDFKKYLAVSVTGELRNAIDKTVQSTSVKVLQGVIAPGKVSINPSRVFVGEEVTASITGWQQFLDSEITYQWLRDDQAIPGANSKKYIIKEADGDKVLKVQITGNKYGYEKTVAVSSGTEIVPPGPEEFVPPYATPTVPTPSVPSAYEGLDTTFGSAVGLVDCCSLL